MPSGRDLFREILEEAHARQIRVIERFDLSKAQKPVFDASSEGHAGLVADVIDRLLPRGRQVKTNAHPLVEITEMRQPQHNPKLVHLVNVSGHSSTAFFSPVDMRDILVELNEPFTRARAVRLDTNLSVTPNGSGAMFALPHLGAYEVVVLE